ncbi:glycosyltransferase 87 family protein [Longispora sp. K20-0274]|uniref:glycosyltransferase 87 family protein n=1 Tax=Longispora sp. K20-0274 TaxID=3088255 RepID=UPI00399C0A50
MLETVAGPGPREAPPGGAAWGRTLATVGAVGVLGVLTVLVTSSPHWVDQTGLVALTGGSWLVFGLAAWLVRGVPTRPAVALILLSGLVLPALAALGPPRSSDDLYRYVWDGRVQAAGVDPYRYAPADPALAGLRDGFLWPATGPWCVPGGCTLVNRPAVRTIYPPAAEAYFLAVHALAPADSRTRPIQLAGALAAFATTVLLVCAAPRVRPGRTAPAPGPGPAPGSGSGLTPGPGPGGWRGFRGRWVGRPLEPGGVGRPGPDLRLAVLWAWCPTVILEAGNNAHVDVVAALVAGAALLVLARARTRRATVWGGVLLGLAVAVKLTPALLGPAVLRRRPVLVVAGAAGAVAAVYLPHVLAVGAGVLGYIPGYLTEEGYANGSRFALLTAVLPGSWATPVAALVLAGAAVWTMARSDPDRPWDAAVGLVGAALLVTTPGYSWYAILLVLLVALSGRAEWLAVAVAGQLALHADDLHLAPAAAQRLGYGAALLAVLVVGVARRRNPGRASPAARPPVPERDRASGGPLPAEGPGAPEHGKDRCAPGRVSP